jgi:hypothetical protein
MYDFRIQNTAGFWGMPDFLQFSWSLSINLLLMVNQLIVIMNYDQNNDDNKHDNIIVII